MSDAELPARGLKMRTDVAMTRTLQLSGPVAILAEDGQSVVETRDLGPVPVGVKPGRVLPLIEIRPEAERLGSFADVIGQESVTRTWSVAELEIGDYQAAIETLVDAVARQRGYSSAVSCASYIASTNPQWAAEAGAFVAWRDAAWAYAFAELEKVQGGQREVPALDAFLGELPAIEWPE